MLDAFHPAVLQLTVDAMTHRCLTWIRRRQESRGSSRAARRWMSIIASLHTSAALPWGTVLTAARSAAAAASAPQSAASQLV